jgi:hypothetical protein
MKPVGRNLYGRVLARDYPASLSSIPFALIPVLGAGC